MCIRDSSSIVQFQKGVFRTNCIDCLDRTNVVQSLLATENLKEVLKRMAILSPVDDLMKQANFQVDSSKFPFAFRNHFEKKHFFLLFLPCRKSTKTLGRITQT